MIIHVEYADYKRFLKNFQILSHKYATQISGVALHFDGKVSKKPYRFLQKKFPYIALYLRAKFLNAKWVDLCNRSKIDLHIQAENTLTKKAKTLLAKLRRATVVYSENPSPETLVFFEEQPHLLVCSPEKDGAFCADFFHLALHRQPQYQCKCSSCLSSLLYITKADEVCFCPFRPEESKLCTIDCDGDYFDNENFVKLLNEQIAKRERCKNACRYYPVCRGGCALQDVCGQFQAEYPIALETAKNALLEQTPLDKLPPALGEAILRGVAQGKIKPLKE